MGLFDKFKKPEAGAGVNAVELLQKHDKGELNDADFLREFGNAKVYYSTPFGDHKDGTQKVFLLQGPNGTGLLPVFSSKERIMEHYEAAGRVAYGIFEGSFSQVLETNIKVNMGNPPVQIGIVVDPGYFNLSVEAAMLTTVYKMTK